MQSLNINDIRLVLLVLHTFNTAVDQRVHHDKTNNSRYDFSFRQCAFKWLTCSSSTCCSRCCKLPLNDVEKSDLTKYATFRLTVTRCTLYLLQIVHK